MFSRPSYRAPGLNETRVDYLSRHLLVFYKASSALSLNEMCIVNEPVENAVGESGIADLFVQFWSVSHMPPDLNGRIEASLPGPVSMNSGFSCSSISSRALAVS
jgi:hypothetical protein